MPHLGSFGAVITVYDTLSNLFYLVCARNISSQAVSALSGDIPARTGYRENHLVATRLECKALCAELLAAGTQNGHFKVNREYGPMALESCGTQYTKTSDGFILVVPNRSGTRLTQYYQFHPCASIYKSHRSRAIALIAYFRTVIRRQSSKRQRRCIDEHGGDIESCTHSLGWRTNVSTAFWLNGFLREDSTKEATRAAS